MQYVGARYVPKFMGTYDNTQAYENMCVVDNGAGTSYISKKPTPAGTPLTDTDYWAIYGASNGAIINLQNQIDVINNTSIPAIQAEIDALDDKKYVIFGDSYGENYSSGGDNITGWIDLLVGILGLSADQYTKFATGGYGFYANNNSWLTPLSAMSADNDVTDVLFVGGHNDAHYAVDGSDLLTAMINTITTAKAKFPNAKIWVGFCSIDLTGLDKTNKCRQLYSDVCSRYGAAFMDVQYSIYKTNYILNDAHPNTLGNAVLAGAISSVLKGGTYYNATERTQVIGVSDPNVQATSLSNYYYSIYGGKLRLDFDSATIISASFSTPIDVAANANDEIILQKLPAKFPLHRSKNILGYVPCIMAWSSLGYVTGTAYMFTDSGYLKCRLLALNSGNYINAGHTDTLVQLNFGMMHFESELAN